MVVAQEASYPILSVFWSMLIFFSWFLWIWLLFVVYADLFRRDDISGWAKTGWVVFTFVLPFIGVFTYLVAQGRGMSERRAGEASARRAAMDDYVRSVAATSGSGNGNGSGGDQIATAKSLLDSGALTPAEYEAMKRKVLA
jgi:hypothetical protein